jgi:hypothetical protein
VPHPHVRLDVHAVTVRERHRDQRPRHHVVAARGASGRRPRRAASRAGSVRACPTTASCSSSHRIS